MDPERQGCLLGIQRTTLHPCEITSAANFIWTVWDETGIVESDTNERRWEETPGKNIAVIFGFFRAQRGARYHLHVDLLTDPTELNSGNLTFIVKPLIDPDGEAVMWSLALLLGAVIAVVGILLIWVPWLQR